MELTNDIIEKHGFKRINNSMFRFNDITLQNGYINQGGSLLTKILTTKKAYKLCYRGGYICMITLESQLLKWKKFSIDNSKI